MAKLARKHTLPDINPDKVGVLIVKARELEANARHAVDDSTRAHAAALR